jgi:uncharacterized protein (DUF1015 family)
MRSRYLARSPYNLVRVILGETQPGDGPAENVYTRAAAHLNEWIASGVLVRDGEAAIFPYFQEFTVPDTGERLVRKGFIALGAVEDYAEGVVHPHERTLSGPKKDRLELLRHTHAHFEELFMLYPDPAGEVDALLDEAAAAAPPIADITDEYGAVHKVWKMAGGEKVQRLMRDKKLLIADGHHRYETALAFRNENPNLPGADRVIMTFVNMHSDGLRILATHRLVSGLAPEGLLERFLTGASADFETSEIASLDELRASWAAKPECSIFGAAIGSKLYRVEHRTARGALDVRVLHEELIAKALGIDEAAVRDEKNILYIRGIDAAVEEARQGKAQIALLLKPTSIEQVADTSFSGGVMPQKSTDFYPKLLSGLVIYKLD